MLDIAVALLMLQAAPAAVDPAHMPGEDKVDPYTPAPANVGNVPFKGNGMAKAFHGQAGIKRIVDGLVTAAYADPVIKDIFESHDNVRLDRTLFEQFCYLLNAGCTYSGRDMAAAHKDLGVQRADMNRLVVLLQKAMQTEGVSFQAQNRFLSKLAPMNHDVVTK
jgi:hemoglobin